MAKEIFMITEEDLEKDRKATAIEAIKEYKKIKNGKKAYYISQVAKLLDKSSYTIKKLCENGFIKTTASGMITQAALDEYLNSENK